MNFDLQNFSHIAILKYLEYYLLQQMQPDSIQNKKDPAASQKLADIRKQKTPTGSSQINENSLNSGKILNLSYESDTYQSGEENQDQNSSSNEEGDEDEENTFLNSQIYKSGEALKKLGEKDKEQEKEKQKIKSESEKQLKVEEQSLHSQSPKNKNKPEQKHLEQQLSKSLKQKVQIHYESFVQLDPKYLLLMYLLLRNNVEKIAKSYGETISINPKNYDKIFIRAENQKIGEQYKAEIVKVCEECEVIKVDLRPEIGKKLRNCRKLNQVLKNKKMIIFDTNLEGTKEMQRSYYIGGCNNLKNLSIQMQEIKNLRFHQFFLMKYRDTRSYRIFFEKILNKPDVLKILQEKFKVKYVEIIKHYKYYHQKGEDRQKLQILLANNIKIQANYKQFSDFLQNLVQSKFYCMVFLFKTCERYFEKLKHEKAEFFILQEKKAKISYLYILCKIEDYQNIKEDLQKQIEKLNEEIRGVRYFNNINPDFKEYNVYNEKYYARRFPKINSYSMIIRAKREERFDWKGWMNTLK